MGLVIGEGTEVITAQKILGATCDNCGAELKSVEQGHWHWSTIENALWVKVDGGYGMYFDNNEAISLLFCESCADKLMATFPVILKTFQAQFPSLPAETDGDTEHPDLDL